MNTAPLPVIRSAADLKFHVEQSGNCPHFFTRSTMKFFGDTMRNFYVPRATVTVETVSGEKVECFELRRRKAVKHNLSSSAYFDARTFARVHPKN